MKVFEQHKSFNEHQQEIYEQFVKITGSPVTSWMLTNIVIEKEKPKWGKYKLEEIT